MIRLMDSLMKWLQCCLMVGLLASAAGCGGHGGVVEETDEFTFDQMAEMAAAETESNEESGEQ